MAKFCKKCGSIIDEKTGLCPRCNPILPPKQEVVSSVKKPENKTKSKKNKTENEKNINKKPTRKEKKAAKKAAMSTKQKVKRFFIKLLALFLALILLVSAGIGALLHFDVINFVYEDELLAMLGIAKEEEPEEEYSENPDAYKVTPPDADTYFEDKADIISDFYAEDSYDVCSEEEAYEILTGLGFDDFPITTEYSMDGTYYEAKEISSTSDELHPVYKTNYVSRSNELWSIIFINGVVMANPVSYNMQSNLGVGVVFSETDVVTSYDSTTNKFYEIIPNESTLIVVTVNTINSKALNKLTIGEIDAYV